MHKFSKKASRYGRKHIAASKIARAWRRRRKFYRKPLSRPSRNQLLGLQNKYNSIGGLSIFRPKNPFPRQFKLTTSSTELAVRVSGAYVQGFLPPTQQFRPQSLYDPLYAVGTNQKRYMYDSILSNYYKKYTVDKFWVQISISDANEDVLVAAGISDDTANIPGSAQDFESVCKLQNVQTVCVEANQASEHARKVIRLAFNCYAWKKRNYLNNERGLSDVNANPAVYAPVWISVKNRTNTDDPEFTLDVQFVARARYSERRDTSFLT